MNKIKRLKYACYSVNVTMSAVTNLSPVLFLTFRSLYGISYSLLGFLVFINFLTQLGIDLIFSFFSHKFNIEKTVKSIPVISFIGFFVYAFSPFVFKDSVYIGLLIGTIIFSAASGLAEVLISPVIAAIPSDDPDREMSKLHSIYAWGVVFVIVVSTLFLLFCGNKNWQWLPLIFSLIPAVSAILFSGVELPKMATPEKVSGALKLLKNKSVLFSVFAIFLGGASECTMAQWCSGYIEKAIGIEKVWGDLFGVAMFSVMLGLGRSLYAKFGKNIEKILILGAVGAVICYFTAAVSSIPVLGLIACAATGFCTSMLWPGNLVVASKKFPTGGVFIYALMASGGDFGASVAPQLVGIVTDTVSLNSKAAVLASNLSLTVEQFGMKIGMLVGLLFPLLAVFVNLHLWRSAKKKQ